MIPNSPFLRIDLTSQLGIIQVSGKNAKDFLQGQLTNDIQDITPTKHSLGALCNPKGRIRALFRIFQFHDAYYLQLPRLLLPNVMVTLKKFAKFSKVIIEDDSNKWRRMGLWHNNPTFSITDNLPLLKQLKNCELQVKESLIILSLSDNYPRFEFLSRDLSPLLWEQLGNVQETQNFDAWKLLDIQAGIPEIWPETVEKFLPHDINLPQLGAVSFTKGCYCGQEIVARMEYRGNLKKKLLSITLDEIIELPLPGSEIVIPNAPNRFGTVVTAAFLRPNTAEVLMIS